MKIEYITKGNIYQTTPVDFPIGWGQASLQRLKALHLGSFMERISDGSGHNEVFFGIKLDGNQAGGLVGAVPMRFRIGSVALSIGVLIVFAVQFADNPSNPLNTEHLIDPTRPTEVAFLSDMLSQKRWLLPIVDQVGNIVTVKLVRYSAVLVEGLDQARSAAVAHVGVRVQNWKDCQADYDSVCKPGHFFSPAVN